MLTNFLYKSVFLFYITLDIVEGAADFFARVEDAERVKNIFGLLEKSHNFFAVLLKQIWSANYSVVVLGSD